MTPLNDWIDEFHLNNKELMTAADAEVQVATGGEDYGQGMQ